MSCHGPHDCFCSCCDYLIAAIRLEMLREIRERTEGCYVDGDGYDIGFEFDRIEAEEKGGAK